MTPFARLSPLLTTTAALIRLGRLRFLLAGVVLHLLGVAVALYAGAPLDLGALLWGQIAITATQVMTHYSNDYFDLEADRANRTPTQWSGGSRVLIDGTIPPRLALSLALIFAGAALVALAVLSLAVRPGVGTFALLFTALAGAWFYSAPPLRLHSRGIGELTTMIVVALFTPLTGYVLHAGRVDALPILAAAPLCALQFAMLIAIEFPDADGDRSVHKRTLVVRLGARAAIRVYVGALCAAYLMLPPLVIAGLPPGAAWAAAGLSPLALLLLWRVQRGDWRSPNRWNPFAFYTIVLLMATAAAELFAFVLLIGMG
ncbi:MAG: prenyltransferase [bacterium]|nr:prenyltransferase [bacterium]